MKIHEWTDEQLSLFIAEKLEPRASLPTLHDKDFETYIAGECMKWCEHFKCWQPVFRYDEGDVGRWQPRDMTAPEMTCFLMAAVLTKTNTPELLELLGEDHWITFCRQIYHRVNRISDCDVPIARLLARTTAQYAALSLGWKEEA